MRSYIHEQVTTEEISNTIKEIKYILSNKIGADAEQMQLMNDLERLKLRVNEKIEKGENEKLKALLSEISF